MTPEEQAVIDAAIAWRNAPTDADGEERDALAVAVGALIETRGQRECETEGEAA